MTKPKSFTEQFAPRHTALEALQDLLEKPGPNAMVDYVGSFASTAEPPPQPKTLLEVYCPDPRPLVLDAASRPEHYTERQLELIRCLGAGTAAYPEMTPAEANELMMRLVERSATPKPAAKPRPQEPESEATFENQAFDDAITII